MVYMPKCDDHLFCFPLYPPLELFHSFGFCPIVLWSYRNRIKENKNSSHHLQNFVCAVARDVIDVLGNPPFIDFKAFFAYNACDTLRNLPEIFQIACMQRGMQKPVFLRLHIPAAGLQNEHQKKYFRFQIHSLIQKLESVKQIPFSKERFSKSIEIFRELRNAYQQAQNAVAQRLLGYKEFSNTLQHAMFMPPEKQYEIFKKIAQKRNEYKNNAIPILISGILPPPNEVVDFLEEAGLHVAANDIAAEGRSFETYTPLCDDPVEYYIEFYKHHHPCTTLLFTAQRRIQNLLEKMQKVEARAVVFVGEKFCEYEYFEVVHLEKQMKLHGVPMLKLEFSPEDGGNYEQMKTRIDAFAEFLREQKDGKPAQGSSQKN